MWIHLSCPCDACAFIYRHLTPTVHLFQIAQKAVRFCADAFFKKCQGREKLLTDFFWWTIILSITMTKTKGERNLCSVACNSCNSSDYIHSTLWDHESTLTEESLLELEPHYILQIASAFISPASPEGCMFCRERKAGPCWRGEELRVSGSENSHPSQTASLLFFLPLCW